MKFRAIVEYEYPIEHKPPVKAELILHGDRVVTDSIEPLPQEPFINKPCVSAQVCEHDKQKVLDKIRAELHATAEMHEDGDYYLRDEWIDEYFDKYRAESEKTDG